ncbi:MAG: histidine phosphatase family protein [Bryobacteraceae bacterium]
MPKLFLVRHAEPELTGVLLGRLDCALSGEGRRQAEAAMSSLKVAIVYASPLRRARDTARCVRAPVVVLNELAEISLGDWDGKSWAEVERQDPELARRKQQDWFNVTPPGAEPWSAFESRVLRALERIRRGPFPAAVVAHIAVNAALAHQAAGGDPVAFRQNYCEITEVELKNEFGTDPEDPRSDPAAR